MQSTLGIKYNTVTSVQGDAKIISLMNCTGPFLLSLLLVNNTWAANLGDLPSQTGLQSTTGNAIAKVCAGFGGGANVSNPLQQELFVTCASMVQNGNQIAGSGPTSTQYNLKFLIKPL